MNTWHVGARENRAVVADDPQGLVVFRVVGPVTDAEMQVIAAAPELLELARLSHNLIKDYVETIEKNNPGATLNYGRMMMRFLAATLIKAGVTL